MESHGEERLVPSNRPDTPGSRSRVNLGRGLADVDQAQDEDHRPTAIRGRWRFRPVGVVDPFSRSARVAFTRYRGLEDACEDPHRAPAHLRSRCPCAHRTRPQCNRLCGSGISSSRGPFGHNAPGNNPQRCYANGPDDVHPDASSCLPGPTSSQDHASS